jgi:hypothetical protein
MTPRRPKDIGTASESAVVRHIRSNGFDQAERRALRGVDDWGDIAGTPGVAWSVKGGAAAKDASDNLIDAWMAEAEAMRARTGSEVAVLVTQRRGVGEANAGRWHAWLTSTTLARLLGVGPVFAQAAPAVPVRMLLADACRLLRWAGHGTPIADDREGEAS